MFALMAGAQKRARTVDWQHQSYQPLPGAGESGKTGNKTLTQP